jgi:hypothetical protein
MPFDGLEDCGIMPVLSGLPNWQSDLDLGDVADQNLFFGETHGGCTTRFGESTCGTTTLEQLASLALNPTRQCGTSVGLDTDLSKSYRHFANSRRVK